MNILPAKDPQEQYIHTIDFQSLTGTETVSYANANVTLLKGSVDDTSDIVLTTLTSDGAVNLTIRRGTHNQDYAVRVLVSASPSGNVFEEDLVVLVREVFS